MERDVVNRAVALVTGRGQKTVRSAAAPWAWTRLDARRRWRSLAGIALVAALSCGVVMAATAGARRGGSAVDRLRGSTRAASVMVAVPTFAFDWDRVRRMPGVEAVGAVYSIGSYGLNVEGVPPDDGENYWAPAADTEWTRTVEVPAVVAGRLADPGRVDEAMITATYAERNHLGVGDSIAIHLFTRAQHDAYITDNVQEKPAGPRQPLRIVGVVRSPAIDNDIHKSVLLTTIAFTDTYRANLLGSAGNDTAGAVRLRDGEAGVPDFQRRLAKLTGRDDLEVQNLFDAARDAKADTGFESNALLAFALAALIASVVVLGQGAARYAAASAGDLQVLQTLGMTRRQTAVAAATGPALAAVAGAAVAAVVAVATSGLFPIGTAADYEPDPGVRLDLVVLAGTAVGAVLLVVGGAVVGAWRAFVQGGSATTHSQSIAAATAYRLGLPVAAVFGIRFALEPGRGRTALPVRPALVGAVVGVLGVLAALTFHAGVEGAASNPREFGHLYQVEGWLGFDGKDFLPPQKLWDGFAADPDIAGVNDTRASQAAVGGLSFPVYSYQAAVPGRPLPVVILSGRMPSAPNEIALAPDTLHASGAKVGKTVVIDAVGRAPMVVTGVAFVPEVFSYSKGAWTTGDGFRTLFPDGSFLYHQVFASVRSGADPAVVSRRIAAGLHADGAEFGPSPTPREATRFNNVRVLPLALGAFLAVLAVAAAGHALSTAIRRRRGDLAVLLALGMTRRQNRLIVVTQATTLACVGLLFGVPLGVALGRTAWRAVATSAPVVYVPPVAPLALALVAPVALLTGLLLAVVPGRRAARIRVPDALRTD